MKLKSFGCSFIYGTDLSDEIAKLSHFPSNISWPALLAKQINFKYECFARPGSGNLRILEQILAQIDDHSENLFVIGWSWIDRFDYVSSQDLYPDEWKTILPVDTSEEAEFYYRRFHSQYKDKLMTLIYIKAAIDALREKNIPFIMTFMDELILDNKWNMTPTVLKIQNYIRPYLTTFEGQTFLNWSKKNNFPISKTMHPLETAHEAGARYMLSELENYTIGRLIFRETA